MANTIIKITPQQVTEQTNQQTVQKQEQVIKVENNISAITTVGDVTKKLITAAGTQKGISFY